MPPRRARRTAAEPPLRRGIELAPPDADVVPVSPAHGRNTALAFVVGALSNAYFAKQEAIRCEIVEEAALFDPGPDGTGALSQLPVNAPPEAVARAKKFIGYRLPGDTADRPLHYLLSTPSVKIERDVDGGFDVIRPGMIAIARTITKGTTLKGNSDTIIPIYLNSAFPKWFGVIFLMTLLSAAMSTLSSQFHTMGTAIGRDIFEPMLGGDAARSVRITRTGIVIGLVAALILGKLVRGNIIALATAIFFGVCAASFLPSFVGGLFWRRMTRSGALASIIVGLGSSVFWTVFVNAKTATGLGVCQSLFGKATLIPASFSPTWAVVDPILVALPLSALAAVVVSLATKPMPAEHVAHVFAK